MHLQFRIILLIALIAMTTDFASAQNSLLQRLDAMMKIGQISWLVTAGEQALTEGQLQQAHAHFAGALERVQAVRASGLPSPFNGNGDSIEGTISSYLGAVAIYRDDFGTAVPYLVRSYQLLERAGLDEERMLVANQLGLVLGHDPARIEQAQRLLEASWRWFDDHGKPSHAASALANLCGLHMDNGDLDLGADRCRAAIERFEHGAAPAELAMVRAMFAVVQSRRGDYADASVQLKKALEENQGHADATTAAKVLGNVGSALTDLARYGDALDALEGARRLFNQLGSAGNEALVRTGLARVHRLTGDLDQASKEMVYAQALASRIDDPMLHIELDLEDAAITLYRYRFEEAHALFGDLVGRARPAGAGMPLANALNGRGQAAMALGRLHDARRDFEQAWRLGAETGQVCQQCEARGNLGELYRLMGLWRQALVHQRERLARLGRTGQNAVTIDARLDLALLYLDLGLDDQTNNTLAGVLADLKRLNLDAPRLRARLQLLRGRLLSDSDPATAEQVLKAARDHYRKLHELPGLGAALNGLAALRLAQDDPDEARKHLNEALEIATRTGLASMAAGLEVNLAWLDLRQNHPKDAIERCTAADAILAAAQSSEHWQAQFCLGRAHVALGREQAALDAFESAMAQLEGQRPQLPGRAAKEAFSLRRTGPYDAAIALLARMHARTPTAGHAAQALNLFERRQARSALADVAGGALHRVAGVPGMLLARLGELDIVIADLAERLAKERLLPDADQDKALIDSLVQRGKALADETQALEQCVQRDHPALHALRHPRPLDAARIRALLRPGQDLALAYLASDSGVFVWSLTASGIGLNRLKLDLAALRDDVDGLRSAIKVTDKTRGFTMQPNPASSPAPPPDLDQLAYQLFSQLLPPPVDAGLANAERLYLVPTDVLLALPFDVLVTKPVVANQAPRRLVEGPAIVYLDSLSQLAPVRITNANRTPSERLLAFADPISAPVATNNGQPSPGGRAPGNPLARLPALPNSRTEVEAIRDLLDPAHANSRLLTGANATRVELLRLSEHGHAAEYRYLVFATHGLAPGASPGLLEPALVLSPMHPDELLTRSDIYGLDLGADLVSLSACNTAVGEIRPGEGTLGLVRAFRFAGSPAVTATLWPVVDAAAEAMNRRFYYHLAAGVGGAQALRRAKLDLLAGSGISVKQDFSAPRHWAAVVLFGEPPTTVATRPLMQHSAQAPK